METPERNRSKPFLWIGAVTIVIALLAALAVRQIHGRLYSNLDSTEKKLNELKLLLDEQQEKAQQAEAQVIELAEENNTLQETILDLKGQIESSEPSQDFISYFIKRRNPKVSTVVAREIAKNVMIFCKENYIPASLAVGVIEVESSYNPMATSSKNAKGLMQIIHSAWKDKIGEDCDLFEINQNIKAGCEILNELLQNKQIQETLFSYLGDKDGEYVKKILTVAMTFEIELIRQRIQEEILDTEGLPKEG